MTKDVIREAVRDRYGRIAAGAEESCCGTSCCGGTSESSVSTAVGYDEEQLDLGTHDLQYGRSTYIIKIKMKRER